MWVPIVSIEPSNAEGRRSTQGWLTPSSEGVLLSGDVAAQAFRSVQHGRSPQAAKTILAAVRADACLAFAVVAKTLLALADGLDPQGSAPDFFGCRFGCQESPTRGPTSDGERRNRSGGHSQSDDSRSWNRESRPRMSQRTQLCPHSSKFMSHALLFDPCGWLRPRRACPIAPQGDELQEPS